MLRRVLGVVAVVLGAVGLLLSVASLAGVWVYGPEVQRRALELAGAGESALGALQEDLEEAGRTVGQMEEQFRSAEPLVGRLAQLEKERLGDPEARRETFQRIQALVLTARTFIRLQRGLLRAGDRSLAVAGALPLGQAKGEPGPARGAVQTLEELEALVDQVERISKRLEEPGEAERLVARVRKVYERMGAVLGQARDQIRVLGETVEGLEAEAARVRERLPAWVAWAKGVTTALLLWSAWAQGALVAHGRRLWRRAG